MISPFSTSLILDITLLSTAVFSIGLGFFVWWQNKKSPINIVFFLLTFTISFWFTSTLLLFRNCGRAANLIFWDKLIYSAIVFIPTLWYHFILELTQRRNQKKYKIFLLLTYLISIFFLFLVQTEFFLKGTFLYRWGCHTIAQPGHHIFLVFFFSCILTSFYLLFNSWRKTQDPILKIQTRYILGSSLLFFVCSIEFLPAYQIAVFPIGYFFPLIWLVILTFVIARYQFLNIKAIAVDILAMIIIFVMTIFTILAQDIVSFLGRLAFLFLILVFAFLTIRGVHREISEKEILEKKVKERTQELESAKKTLEESKNILEIRVKARTKELKELAESLEIKIRERTKELQEKISELERFQRLAVGRELKMIELKKEIEKLKNELKEKHHPDYQE